MVWFAVETALQAGLIASGDRVLVLAGAGPDPTREAPVPTQRPMSCGSSASTDDGIGVVGAAGSTRVALVVVVHGSMDRSAGLLRLSRRSTTTHCVIRYDRRGYGRSAEVGPRGPSRPTSTTWRAARLTGAARAPAIVFGHSFGGTWHSASLLAGRSRCAPWWSTRCPLSWLDWWPGNSAGAAAMAVDDPGDAAEAFMRRLVGDAVWERLPASKQAERRAEGAAMVAELADLRRRAPWDGDRITAPVLALHGEHARPHHRAAMEGLGEMIPGCRTAMVPAAGHAGPHTHADAVAAAMAPFLASLSDDPIASVG
jgi:pimeloyl-ACP methyl ester carboxylesterase